MDRHDSGALVLGRTVVDPGPADSGDGDLITFAGDGHLVTIAPRRPGEKDRSCLLPNLLAYPGQTVAVDVDGHAYDATAAARRELGHEVVGLDPFGVTGQDSDALDPLDLLDGLVEPTVMSCCLDIADLLSPRAPGRASAADGEAFGLLAAMIGYVHAGPNPGTFDMLYQMLHEGEFTHNIAVALDTVGKHLPVPTYMELASYLSRDDRLRTGVLTTLRSRFGALGAPEVRRSLSRTTVPLLEMGAGPVTVYLILPADRVASCSVLLRLWVGTLLLGAVRVRDRAARPTLFLLDRCADLGPFPLLEALLTRGSGGGAARIWTFWHDVHQLRTTYPGSWREIVSGCGVVQAFATGDAAAAAEAEALLGLPVGDVWSLGLGDQVLRVDRTAPRRALRLAS